MINLFKTIFWYPFSSKHNIEKYQKQIRDIEWNSFKKHINKNSSFLDVGCGSGDNLMRAQLELNCSVQGIDPSPGEHGVGRFIKNTKIQEFITKGSAEEIPYDDNNFDIVFCSHVLEHVMNEKKSLNEITRVLKQDGILIIGMPTASMAIIALVSYYLFTTHVNILFFIKSIGKKDMLKRLTNIFIPPSHSIPNHTFITHDLIQYRISKWRKKVSEKFDVLETITPCLYPYPDYIQWFPKLKIKGISSSVFFICKKIS
jgi:2-polyprenyl-3-methyl-5-hydroxy-6-metoxy-1,4-benzoquinol methylase